MLKKIWRLRFQGWQWVFLPVLIGFSMALFAMIVGLIDPPSPTEWLLTITIVVVTLILNLIAIYEIGSPLGRMVEATRGLNQKRMEARARTADAGISGELAGQINQMATRLLQEQDQVDSLIAQSSIRLRRDYQDLLEQHQELRRSMAASLKAVESQSELFSNLSHELRTPLTAIVGYTDLLRRSALNAEQQTHLLTVEKSAQGMLEMINNLLDWGRIEAGRMRLNDDHLDVQQIVEDVTGLLAPMAYEKNLELVHIVYEDVPRWVQGDAQRLRQILTNLLSNAIKFTQRGEVVLRVMRDRANEGRVWLNFSVSDTGPGIPAEQQRHLFHAFQQTAGTRGGSGLGLTITRKLAELMGGRVDMQSTPGQGSTFGVVIPFRLSDVQSEEDVPEPLLRGLDIWVLESHPIARLALIHQLERWQMTVRSFDTVPLLTSALNQTRPRLILLGLKAEDFQHPDYLALLQRCAARQPPLLALVASASTELHQALRRSGAVNALPKSISQPALMAELKNLLLKPAVSVPPLAGQRALVTDNNVVNRRYIATLCRELGMTVSEAASGQEALEHLRRSGADVVLLDARMPGMEGIECARIIRADDPNRRVRLVIISANLEPAERSAFTDAGADGILIKPFDGRALLRLLAPRTGRLPPSKKLTTDPQLLQLLREELPLQLRELEEALAKHALNAAQDAAHQLRGTAAFYHIESLKQSTSAMEQLLRELTALDDHTAWEGPLRRVQEALQLSLQHLETE